MSFNNGRYRIKNQQSGTYFDVPQSGEAHGWQGYAQNLNQQWDLEQANGGFRIKNAGSGQWVNTRGEPRDGCRVITSGQPRIWEIKHEQGGWAIFAQGSREVIDLDYGKTENGAWINVWGFTGANQQYWQFEQVSGGQQQGGYSQQQQGQQQQQPQGGNQYGGQQQQGYQQQGQQGQQQSSADQWAAKNAYHGPLQPGAYFITNCLAGTALDLNGGKSNEGNEVIGFASNRANNQTWYIESGQNGYRIKNGASGTYLGYQNAGEGAEIGGYRDAKEFQVNPGPNQNYQFQCATNTNLVMDLVNGVHHGRPVDGAKVVLWTNNNGENQFWRLDKA